MANSKPILIAIYGPTASGKTDFAIQLARHFNTEIISADSRQIYKEISIGTAKPTEDQLSLIPHHFINQCSIHESYSAGQFEREAIILLERLFKTHQVVVAAGGTGLYLKGLCEGFDTLPKANAQLREELQRELNEKGVDYLFERLQAMDIEGSKSIDSKNPHRVMRALEMLIESGKNLSELKTYTPAERPFKIIKLRMELERSTLYERINQRVDDMISNGLIEEAKSVYPNKQLQALQTVGYSELFDYFDGKYSLTEAIDKIKQHTRNYAKRQLTWIKKEENCIAHTDFDATRLLQ